MLLGMRSLFSIITFSFSCLVCAGESESVQLRSLISEWVDTMRKSTDEESRWARDEVVLKANLEGLRAELQQIEQQAALVKARLNSASVEDQEKLSRKDAYDEARQALKRGLEPLEASARLALNLVPEFFMAESDKLQGAREALQKDSESVSLNSRLSAVSTILTELERFHQARWIKDIAHTVEGQEMSLKAVYFGLGAAYGANDDGSVAVVGRPGSEGWSFERIDDPVMAERTRVLVEVATGSGVSSIVELPVAITP